MFHHFFLQAAASDQHPHCGRHPRLLPLLAAAQHPQLAAGQYEHVIAFNPDIHIDTFIEKIIHPKIACAPFST